MPAEFSANTVIFSGEFRHSLDNKNRITIPSDWRRKVSEPEVDDFFVIPDEGNTFLFAMPPKDFHGVRDIVNATTTISPLERQSYIRSFYGSARRCVLDRQGRLVLPEDHCRQAGLRGEVVLVGVQNKFEIWNAEAYAGTRVDASKIYKKVSERIVI